MYSYIIIHRWYFCRECYFELWYNLVRKGIGFIVVCPPCWLANKPFYSYGLSTPASKFTWGWCWSYFDKNLLPPFSYENMMKKILLCIRTTWLTWLRRKGCIKTRSASASFLLFNNNNNNNNNSNNNFFLFYLFIYLFLFFEFKFFLCTKENCRKMTIWKTTNNNYKKHQKVNKKNKTI